MVISLQIEYYFFELSSSSNFQIQICCLPFPYAPYAHLMFHLTIIFYATIICVLPTAWPSINTRPLQRLFTSLKYTHTDIDQHSDGEAT